MSTSKRKTKNVRKTEIKEKKPDVPSQNIEIESEKPFDFGGIPARDLKKNLGCG